jgi:hypothetical protein
MAERVFFSTFSGNIIQQPYFSHQKTPTEIQKNLFSQPRLYFQWLRLKRIKSLRKQQQLNLNKNDPEAIKYRSMY